MKRHFILRGVLLPNKGSVRTQWSALITINMSGPEQRQAAIDGESEILKDYIIKRCNPCSVDEYGLSALHYAAWNGHIECVKLLVCNTLGVDTNGKRNKSLGLRSCMGYTALHLAALDCPPKRAQEVTMLLLIAGASLSVRCEEYKTPEDIAMEKNNAGFLNALDEFKNVRQDKALQQKWRALQDELNTHYCFQTNSKTRGNVEHFEAKFTLPDFLFTDETRTGNMPEGLQIHEHQIRPLTAAGYDDMDGLDAISCLSFSMEQAIINKERRDRLMEKFDPNFKPIELEKFQKKK